MRTRETRTDTCNCTDDLLFRVQNFRNLQYNCDGNRSLLFLRRQTVFAFSLAIVSIIDDGIFIYFRRAPITHQRGFVRPLTYTPRRRQCTTRLRVFFFFLYVRSQIYTQRRSGVYFPYSVVCTLHYIL